MLLLAKFGLNGFGTMFKAVSRTLSYLPNGVLMFKAKKTEHFAVPGLLRNVFWSRLVFSLCVFFLKTKTKDLHHLLNKKKKIAAVASSSPLQKA